MDPDATLTGIRQTIADARDAMGDGGSNDAEHDALYSLVEDIDALDEWLRKGGFLPADWKGAT